MEGLWPCGAVVEPPRRRGRGHQAAARGGGALTPLEQMRWPTRREESRSGRRAIELHHDGAAGARTLRHVGRSSRRRQAKHHEITMNVASRTPQAAPPSLTSYAAGSCSEGSWPHGCADGIADEPQCVQRWGSRQSSRFPA
jgi:hypothetical protein